MRRLSARKRRGTRWSTSVLHRRSFFGALVLLLVRMVRRHRTRRRKLVIILLPAFTCSFLYSKRRRRMSRRWFTLILISRSGIETLTILTRLAVWTPRPLILLVPPLILFRPMISWRPILTFNPTRAFTMCGGQRFSRGLLLCLFVLVASRWRRIRVIHVALLIFVRSIWFTLRGVDRLRRRFGVILVRALRARLITRRTFMSSQLTKRRANNTLPGLTPLMSPTGFSKPAPEATPITVNLRTNNFGSLTTPSSPVTNTSASFPHCCVDVT